MPDPEQQILASWQTNAEPWIKAIENQTIVSRRMGTDAAIVSAVLAVQPQTVLDLGCGEGWLTRTLSQKGVQTTGVDATPVLIESARQKGTQDFFCMTYCELPQSGQGSFDAVVCNFSLFGETSVQELFKHLPLLLNPQGHLIVQTLHPSTVDTTDISGWRDGSWRGFSKDFQDPAPWFYRTQLQWQVLFQAHGFQVEIQEPTHPDTGEPLSLILTGALLPAK